MDLGDIDPRARVITITETPAMAVLDGSTGMGHVAMTNGMLTAVEKADQSGTGTVIIRNSRPGGSLCGIARLAAGKGLIGLVMSSFEQTACGGAGNPGVAWAVPAPDGRAIADSGDRQSAAGDEVAALCSLLSAGLAGADPLPRKRKAVRSANVVEYCLMAISPAKLGSRDAFFSKWTSLWSAAASSDTSQVPLQASTAIQLAELAAKIKFAVDW
jgi:LDH2 family malate/lactate/ureidoglycolate dehydrogenase